MCILTIRILLYFIILLSNIDENILHYLSYLHFIKLSELFALKRDNFIRVFYFQIKVS